MPRFEDIDWSGIENLNRETFDKTMNIDRELWKKEVLSHEELFERIYDKLPKEFFFIRELLLSALWRSPAKWGQQAESEEQQH
jgi:phosphoenolpyruvate carboxykinase (GTP)